MPSDNEIKILELIADKGTSTQRALAGASGFSLGLTNAILRRLAKTGYIKIQNTSPRRMFYIVTHKGLAEKTRRSYDYIVNTIKTFNACSGKVQIILKEEIKKGRKHFHIVGESNLADLAELALKEIGGSVSYSRHKTPNFVRKSDDAVIDCRGDAADNGEVGVFLLAKLLEPEIVAKTDRQDK